MQSDIAFELKHVNFSYEEGQVTLADVTASLVPGSYTALIGRNGSGKSTLARHLNALLLPDSGKVRSFGIDSQDDTQLFELRRLVGMVFQNPDNQIIGTTVTEDMAFGPENLAIPPLEIAARIKRVLQLLHMEAYKDTAPSNLSGGQKQKLAVGGILVMEPQAVVLDEATSMLDPSMRRELLAFIRQLRLSKGLTIVNVTHHLDEILTADKVLVLQQGHLVRNYSPLDLFNDAALIRELKLSVPGEIALLKVLETVQGRELLTLPDLLPATVQKALLQSAAALLQAATDKGEGALLMQRLRGQMALLAQDEQELAARLAAKVKSLMQVFAAAGAVGAVQSAQAEPEPIIKVEHLTYRYEEQEKNTPPVLDDISFEVKRGEVLAIVGHSGSGKSTLIMHLNALLANKPGEVIIDGLDASVKSNLLAIRRKVSLLFQYPEHQLFAETVYKDIAYGPTKLAYSPAQVDNMVNLAVTMLGFDKDVLQKSPFELSGGQMRKVAFAGIIAMWPEILVLDEPAAGLDDLGRKEMFNYIKLLQSLGKTVVVVSHNMEDVAEFADRVLILQHGKVVKLAEPEVIFPDRDLLAANALEQPTFTACLQLLQARLGWQLPTYAPTLLQTLQVILDFVAATVATTIAPSVAEAQQVKQQVKRQESSAATERGKIQCV
ncbi:energy-coupling factor transporter ATPase [Amygdalobacter indicium]|uniref:ABC transporter ATP-binding protein n=1 Tax=Amygdalobacter indicium TaxID=3029272 RepID=UPI00279E796D|nr:energy-coupling factor transporter ATPase [Amygdalobacter indicium]WEG34231.1 energy-coupling factor transporter ATPase [Amygdalobacter indicium]